MTSKNTLKSYAEAANSTPTSTIILRPNEESNDGERELPEVEEKITTLLKQKHIDANIHRTTSTKSGNIIIKLNAKDPITEITESITDNLNFVASSRPALLPKMTITHIPTYFDTDNLQAQLKNSNRWLQSAESLKVLFTYKVKDFVSAVIKVTPETRDSICDHGFQLKINARVCPVRDRVHVRICSRCSKSGHGPSTCKQEAPTCFICVEAHLAKDCPYKNGDKLSCANCRHTQHNANHSAIDKNCPQITRSRDFIIKNTQWGKTRPACQ